VDVKVYVEIIVLGEKKAKVPLFLLLVSFSPPVGCPGVFLLKGTCRNFSPHPRFLAVLGEPGGMVTAGGLSLLSASL